MGRYKAQMGKSKLDGLWPMTGRFGGTKSGRFRLGANDTRVDPIRRMRLSRPSRSRHGRTPLLPRSVSARIGQQPVCPRQGPSGRCPVTASSWGFRAVTRRYRHAAAASGSQIHPSPVSPRSAVNGRNGGLDSQAVAEFPEAAASVGTAETLTSRDACQAS